MPLPRNINLYCEELRKKNARIVNWLAQGKNIGDAFSEFPEVAIPIELEHLWGAFNGCAVPAGTLLQYTWLDGQFSFYSIEEAIADYRVTLGLIEKDATFCEYWPAGFIPIGTPGDGSRLLINCIKGSPTHGAVYELFHGDGLSRVSNSLGDYFNTLLSWLGAGVLSVLDDGEVDLDLDTYHVIGRQMNPDCDGFDESLPPARQSMEWKTPRALGV